MPMERRDPSTAEPADPTIRFEAVALGEMLIDFTPAGRTPAGQQLFAQNPGGAPANVLAAMAKLGARTAFIGKAGQDMHGRFLRDTLEGCGIDASGFLLSEEYFTTLAFVRLEEAGEREFSFARKPGADQMLREEDIPLSLLQASGILHIGSVSLSDEPARSATHFAVDQAKAMGRTIAYDPNYRASLWSDRETAVREMRRMLGKADLVKISDEETALLTDAAAPEEAAERILAQGAKIVCVTLGKEGAYVRTAEGGTHVPGFPSEAVDATGAGDSFWGGFLFQFSRRGKPTLSLAEAAECARFANAMASLSVEGYGAIPSMPTMEQVAEKLALFSEGPSGV